MNIEIKKANIKNLKDIQNLNLKLFKKEYKEYDSLLNLNWTFGEEGTKYFKKRILEDDGCIFVAIIDKKIIGYLSGGISKAEKYRILPIVAELETLFIEKGYRSKGIGEKLYNKFKKWSKEKNVGKIRVEASYKNELAIKFYEKNNFKGYTTILESDI